MKMLEPESYVTMYFCFLLSVTRNQKWKLQGFASLISSSEFAIFGLYLLKVFNKKYLLSDPQQPMVFDWRIYIIM